MYIEHLSILIKRLGWKVTKIHQHITFEQQRFKKDFIIKNRVSRQGAKNNVEKDFYKLLNNSNFGYDCRNNLDNCTVIPIFDELQEVSYLKNYYNYLDPKVKDFITSDLIKKEIEDTYLDRLNKISTDNKFYEVKKSAVKNDKACEVDTLETFEAKKKESKKRKSLVEYASYKEAIHTNNKIKSMIEFDNEQSNSIKLLAIETKGTISVTTRFMKGKMLMFAKTSIQSFNYDVIDVFIFPDKTVQKIYDKNRIKNCLLLQNVTDTDSTSLTFIFICYKDCIVKESEACNLIFKIIINSKVFEWLDLADELYEHFGVRNEKLKKQVGLYEVENIDNPTMVTIAINPKGYLNNINIFI